jgi:ATP-dependent Lon protease
MHPLDQMANEHFAGLVVRKDLVKAVKGNAIVPSYVLEYLLGQYCASNDDETIKAGIETVRDILAKHYVHRNEAGLVRSRIRESGRYKVIDKVSVALNDKRDVYEASFSNLGIKEVLVDTDTVKANPKLLVSGVWCIADIEYEHSEDKGICPWILGSLKPIQMAHFDFESFLEARSRFTTEEWIDLLMQSIGFNPECFGKRSKLLQLVRLIPYCERNYNLIELGPKGTGKSHIYSEFSPHGILISGGEVTVPKLFVNNQSGKIGLVGYWDVVAFDEFAGQQKRVDKALVDILKNYMANKSFSRGIETLGAEASMVFVGNTRHSVPYMLKHTDLFEELPEKYHDSAFLDRLHFYIPGWEVDVIRSEMFSEGYGFIVDYLAEILRHMRNLDYSDRYTGLELSSDLSTRDKDGVRKTFSGLMKILFPGGKASESEEEELLAFALEGRKRIKDQVLRIDNTFPEVSFHFTNRSGSKVACQTLEEREYPKHYHRGRSKAEAPGQDEAAQTEPETQQEAARKPDTLANEGHVQVEENQRGINFDQLFGPWVKGARKVTVTDPYIRLFYQVRNLMEFCETLIRFKDEAEDVEVHLVTVEDDRRGPQQLDDFEKMQTSLGSAGVRFTWEFDRSGTLHARHMVVDTGWKILLDRGLDIFQPYEMNDGLALGNRLQQLRPCKRFEITYMKT